MILHLVLYNLPFCGRGEVESEDLYRVGYSTLIGVVPPEPVGEADVMEESTSLVNQH